jgi:hypothetical protein
MEYEYTQFVVKRTPRNRKEKKRPHDRSQGLGSNRIPPLCTNIQKVSGKYKHREKSRGTARREE